MNSQPYGIAKQLYRTSYSPSIDNSRPSSLNNPNFSHIIHSQVPFVRPESNTPVMFVRQLNKSNLSNSQNIQQDYKHKLGTSDYYSEPIKEEFMKQIQQKIEELTRKVSKNTEDLKNIKKATKSVSTAEMSFPQEFQRINRRQQTLHQECLGKINGLRDQIAQSSAKLQKIQNEGWQKISLRFDEKHMIKIRNLIEDRVKQQTTKIKLIIQNQTNKINHQLRWQIRRDNTLASPIKSKLKYPFKSTKITYTEFLQTPTKPKESSRLSTRESSESPRSGKVLMSNERTYYVDRQGFLLDEEGYYLLDEQEKMIRLSSGMLEGLRREGLLKE